MLGLETALSLEKTRPVLQMVRNRLVKNTQIIGLNKIAPSGDRVFQLCIGKAKLCLPLLPGVDPPTLEIPVGKNITGKLSLYLL